MANVPEWLKKHPMLSLLENTMNLLDHKEVEALHEQIRVMLCEQRSICVPVRIVLFNLETVLMELEIKLLKEKQCLT